MTQRRRSCASRCCGISVRARVFFSPKASETVSCASVGRSACLRGVAEERTTPGAVERNNALAFSRRVVSTQGLARSARRPGRAAPPNAARCDETSATSNAYVKAMAQSSACHLRDSNSGIDPGLNGLVMRSRAMGQSLSFIAQVYQGACGGSSSEARHDLAIAGRRDPRDAPHVAQSKRFCQRQSASTLYWEGAGRSELRGGCERARVHEYAAAPYQAGSRGLWAC